MATIVELETAVLDLPEPERARLAKVLVLSLESSLDEETARLWDEEAARRAGEVDRGEVETLIHDEVMRDARSRRG